MISDIRYKLMRFITILNILEKFLKIDLRRSRNKRLDSTRVHAYRVKRHAFLQFI